MLAGRVALVTGGGSGIGRSVCQAFALQGARVVAADIDEKKAVQTVASLIRARDGNEHCAVQLDVSDAASVTRVVDSIESKYSMPATVVVNCAGITADNFINKMEAAEFDRVQNINVKGSFLVTRAAADAIVRAANITDASIINLSSIVAKVGNMGQSNYASSKAAVQGLTRTAAKEFAKFNIRCNVILPGFIDTPMVRTIPDKLKDKLRKMIPLGRMGTAEEVAHVCLFLASEDSSYVTGSEIEVTGGIFM